MPGKDNKKAGALDKFRTPNKFDALLTTDEDNSESDNSSDNETASTPQSTTSVAQPGSNPFGATTRRRATIDTPCSASGSTAGSSDNPFGATTVLTARSPGTSGNESSEFPSRRHGGGSGNTGARIVKPIRGKRSKAPVTIPPTRVSPTQRARRNLSDDFDDVSTDSVLSRNGGSAGSGATPEIVKRLQDSTAVNGVAVAANNGSTDSTPRVMRRLQAAAENSGSESVDSKLDEIQAVLNSGAQTVQTGEDLMETEPTSNESTRPKEEGQPRQSRSSSPRPSRELWGPRATEWRQARARSMEPKKSSHPTAAGRQSAPTFSGAAKQAATDRESGDDNPFVKLTLSANSLAQLRQEHSETALRDSLQPDLESLSSDSSDFSSSVGAPTHTRNESMTPSEKNSLLGGEDGRLSFAASPKNVSVARRGPVQILNTTPADDGDRTDVEDDGTDTDSFFESLPQFDFTEYGKGSNARDALDQPSVDKEKKGSKAEGDARHKHLRHLDEKFDGNPVAARRDLKKRKKQERQALRSGLGTQASIPSEEKREKREKKERTRQQVANNIPLKDEGLWDGSNFDGVVRQLFEGQGHEFPWFNSDVIVANETDQSWPTVALLTDDDITEAPGPVTDNSCQRKRLRGNGEDLSELKETLEKLSDEPPFEDNSDHTPDDFLDIQTPKPTSYLSPCDAAFPPQPPRKQLPPMPHWKPPSTAIDRTQRVIQPSDFKGDDDADYQSPTAASSGGAAGAGGLKKGEEIEILGTVAANSGTTSWNLEKGFQAVFDASTDEAGNKSGRNFDCCGYDIGIDRYDGLLVSSFALAGASVILLMIFGQVPPLALLQTTNHVHVTALAALLGALLGCIGSVLRPDRQPDILDLVLITGGLILGVAAALVMILAFPGSAGAFTDYGLLAVSALVGAFVGVVACYMRSACSARAQSKVEPTGRCGFFRSCQQQSGDDDDVMERNTGSKATPMVVSASQTPA